MGFASLTPSYIMRVLSHPNLKVGDSSTQCGAPLAPLTLCLADPAMNGGDCARQVFKGQINNSQAREEA